MILLYILFSLTGAAVLTAVIARSKESQKQGEVFLIAFFALLFAGGAVDIWVVPFISAGVTGPLPRELFLGVFGFLLAASVLLAARPLRTASRHGTMNDTRHDREAVAFDLILWLSTLAFGILALGNLMR